MKHSIHTLFKTTALVAVLCASHSALADAPKVTLGGTSEFQAGFVSDDIANQRGHGFRNDNEISVKVDGKSDMGLGYGAEIWLEADVTTDADFQSTANAAKTFLYVDGAWGRLEGGSTLGPEQALKIGAESIARATGGIDGDWRYFTRSPGGDTFITSPDLILAYGGAGSSLATGLDSEITENLTKVVYYTPKWNGLQAGIAYTSDNVSRGQNVIRNQGNSQDAEYIWLGGINYSTKISDVTLGLAATGEYGSAEDSTEEDLRTYQVGAKLGYMGFSIAGSYGDRGDSLLASTASGENHYWTVGGAYETGPYGASITYLDSTVLGSFDFSSYSLGLDYKLAPGMTPYVEYTGFNMDNPDPTRDNDGHVLLIGSSLNF